MQVLIQRVSQAILTIENEEKGKIQTGLLAFICFEKNDTTDHVDRMLRKLLNYRVFADNEQKMNLSLKDIDGDLMLISQFTLGADTRSGNRPSFSCVATPDQGKALFDYLIGEAKKHYPHVVAGLFGADMQISLVNDGPVTFLLTN